MQKPHYREFDRICRNAAANGGFQRVELTEVAAGPVVAYVKPAERDPAKPSVYCSAGIHGDEPAGSLALCQLMDSGVFGDQANWTLLPLMNPDGWEVGKRTNADGIDLNRDFRILAAKETQAVANWTRLRSPFLLYLSLHEDWETDGFYVYEINASNEPSLSECIIQAVGEVLPIEPQGIVDGHSMCAPGLILHPPQPDEPEGWPEAIFHADLYPLNSYTLETPSRLPLATRVEAHTAALRAALNRCL